MANPRGGPHHRLQSGSSSTIAASLAAVTANPHLRHSPATLAAGSALRPTVPAPPRHNYKNHQRRQSVARLLPDISKLRLLSWLVEASSELINCNIAIMDGVYAKLNKSQESLLFWTTTAHNSLKLPTAATSRRPSAVPPPVPSGLPNSKLVISQQHRKQQKQQAKQQLAISSNRIINKGARNHHSLPLTNYDASSIAAVSFISAGSSTLSRSTATTSKTSATESTTNKQQQQQRPAGVCSELMLSAGTSNTNCDDSISSTVAPFSSLVIGQQDLNNNPNSDSNQSELDDDDDDDNSSAASSTTSSGIHGAATSFSSANSSNGGSSPTSSASSSSGSTAGLDLASRSGTTNNKTTSEFEATSNQRFLSSAEQLSEKIRRTVMEHNYIQNLLVNIIRQHDKQRDQQNQQRRRQMSNNNNNNNSNNSSTTPITTTTTTTGTATSSLGNFAGCGQPQQKIDLADIADALDDGCLCCCHSDEQHKERAMKLAKSKQDSSHQQQSKSKSSTLPSLTGTSATNATSIPTLSNNQTTLLQQQQIVAGNNQFPARKVRRSKKLKGGNNSAQTRQDLLNQLADKLCENCFETHSWIHGNANSSEFYLEPLPIFSSDQANTLTMQQVDQLNTIITKRNATFIKLVQQEVRSTLGKSIELIDLIRREIKSPESIKQKQLMRCFSTSIQLLTSVGNYVVPSQDISSFIPEEIGQNQTSLFSLPSSDFDHLLLYPSGGGPSTGSSSGLPIIGNHNNTRQQQQSHQLNSNYHLAPAPEIPVRRKFNQQRQQQQLLDQQVSSSLQGSLTLDGKAIQTTTEGGAESSSGASSNNSSASSSIARGAVQQSSLTRAQTSSAILDGKTTHGLSYDSIASLSRQQTGDDMFLQTGRPKFWQSSKFNFIKKLLHVKEQRLLRQQSKERGVYNSRIQNRLRLLMRDLTHFRNSQQLLTTENGVNSLLTSMRNVLEFGLYLTLKLY